MRFHLVSFHGCRYLVLGNRKEVILFDVCCGTGTIGLTLASKVKRVVGIEMNEQAVKDAKRNAELNGRRSPGLMLFAEGVGVFLPTRVVTFLDRYHLYLEQFVW